jgi:hypothetical protein
MQRYIIFNQVHKGLRVLLYENALALQRANFTDVDETVPVLENIQETLNLFDTKTRLQEVYLVPVIEPHEPVLATELRRKRIAYFRLYSQLKELLAVYSNERTAAGLLKAGKAIGKAWTLFVVDCLEEMKDNEEVLSKTLSLHYTDQQLMRIMQYIRQTLSAEEMCAYGKCILRGLTALEAISWLKEIQKYLDPGIFRSLCAIAEKVLPADRFDTVMNGLAEGSRLE